MNRGMWLGFLFFVALLLIGFSTLLIGNVRLFKKSYEVEVHFDRVEGLRTGDDVRVEGVSSESVLASMRSRPVTLASAFKRSM